MLRIKGGGLIIKSSPKTAAGQRLVELPSWATSMLGNRRDLAGAHAIDDLQVFPAPQAGGLRDPSNTQKVLRSTFERAGFPGLTSHAFRAALGTLMDSPAAPPATSLTSSATPKATPGFVRDACSRPLWRHQLC